MVTSGSMKRLRVYIDTSVVGGCFDSEFQTESLALFKMVRNGGLVVVASTLLADELRLAPKEVQEILTTLPLEYVESVVVDMETMTLRDAYLTAEVVGKVQSNDALHVALATVARVDMIVSWNFRHIVHFDKIRGFNAVNLREGYLPIEIRSPREII